MHILPSSTWVFIRSSHRKCSIKISVLKNFAKFTGKHSCKSTKFFSTPFSQNTSRRRLLFIDKFFCTWFLLAFQNLISSCHFTNYFLSKLFSSSHFWTVLCIVFLGRPLSNYYVSRLGICYFLFLRISKKPTKFFHWPGQVKTSSAVDCLSISLNKKRISIIHEKSIFHIGFIWISYLLLQSKVSLRKFQIITFQFPRRKQAITFRSIIY